jgi:transcriptional regulator with XRE-family HTH domain
MVKSKEKKAVAETFGQRVVRLRLAKGWESPSDLARAIWGEKLDGRGFMVANNRDTIWRYENDKGKPSRANLEKLAAALGVPPDELDPERSTRVSPVIETLTIEVVSKERNEQRLALNMVLPGDLAFSVFQQINAWLHKNRAEPMTTMTVAEALSTAKAAQKRAPVVAKKKATRK